jgi:hypothetical protein
MSISTALQEPYAGEPTLFDSLSRLVPEHLQASYYRVLAHTRTLSPDDEMLRILEAMGILALLTRHIPKDIADERERIQEMLGLHLQFSTESQEKMLGYVHLLEQRLLDLPSEIEAGLDPQQIAKLLGEGLRQQFAKFGVQEAVAGLQATAAAMASAQSKLTRALTELSDSHGGVVAQIESANRRISDTLEDRIKVLNSLLGEFKTDLLRIWIPLVTGATMLIGLFAGMEIQGCRDTSSANERSSPSSTQIIAPTHPNSDQAPQQGSSAKSPASQAGPRKN